MFEFEKTSKLTLMGPKLARAREDFLSATVTEAQTLETIKNFFDVHKYVLCPHTAVGIHAAEQLERLTRQTICLATAHHAKFADATRHLSNLEVEAVPFQLRSLDELPTRFVELPSNVLFVKFYVEQVTQGGGAKWLLGFLAVGDYFWGRKWLVGATAIVGMSTAVGLYLRHCRRSQ